MLYPKKLCSVIKTSCMFTDYKTEAEGGVYGAI